MHKVGGDGGLAKIESIHLEHPQQMGELMGRMGVDPDGVEKMKAEGFFRVFLLRDISSVGANIIKQEALSLGAECAIPPSAVTASRERCDALLMGDMVKLRRLAGKIAGQPFGLSELAMELERTLDNFTERRRYVWQIKGGELDFSTGPKLMGVINLTPDSFSDGGSYPTVDSAINRALRMVAEGAEIIDVGGVSTRPGSSAPDEQEEWQRLSTFFGRAKEIPVPISVDTFRSFVAKRAISAGASIVNDTSALRYDEHMVDLCVQAKVGVVLMHMQGEPKNMQENPHYENVVGEVLAFLRERLNQLSQLGMEEEYLAVDVGIGFGKTLEHNLALLGGLFAFSELGRPLVVGASRKSFIGKLFNLQMEERVLPSVAVALIAAERGVSVLRVHDVAETAQACKLLSACKNAYFREILGGDGDV